MQKRRYLILTEHSKTFIQAEKRIYSKRGKITNTEVFCCNVSLYALKKREYTESTQRKEEE